jgi:hypothetical protein
LLQQTDPTHPTKLQFSAVQCIACVTGAPTSVT